MGKQTNGPGSLHNRSLLPKRHRTYSDWSNEILRYLFAREKDAVQLETGEALFASVAIA